VLMGGAGLVPGRCQECFRACPIEEHAREVRRLRYFHLALRSEGKIDERGYKGRREGRKRTDRGGRSAKKTRVTRCL